MEVKLWLLSFEGFIFEESWEEKKKWVEKIVEIFMKIYLREKFLIGDFY